MFDFPDDYVFAEVGTSDLEKGLQKMKTADHKPLIDMEWSNFHSPVIVTEENSPGFLRFERAASMFRHPAFKVGVLYAIPTQDANKPLETTTGTIRITPDPAREPSQAETRQLKIDAINDDLEICGLLGENRVMGRFSSPVTPSSFIVAEEPVKREDDTDKGRFVILVDGEFHSIRTVGPNHDSGAVDRLWAEVVKELGNPTVDDVIHQRERKVEMVMVAGDVTVAVKRHVKEIEYDYTASVYDTSVDPDGWFVFGLPFLKLDFS